MVRSIVLLFVVIVAVSDATPFIDCGMDTKTVENVEVQLTPAQGIPGHDITVQVNATLESTVAAGNYELSLFTTGVFKVRVFHKTAGLEEFRPLPWSAGALHVTKSANIPDLPIHGKFQADMKFFDGNGHEFVCLSIDVEVEKENEIVDPLSMSVHDDSIVNVVNTHSQSKWTAAKMDRFSGAKLSDIARLCGTRIGNGPTLAPKMQSFDHVDVPSSYDVRDSWASTCPSVARIRDQGDCGSCWAFGAAEAISDRICIASQGKIQVELSAEDLVSCCSWFECGLGCNGGYPAGAWRYWQTSGIVTGGAYNSSSGCYPYQVPACEHHTQGPLPSCDSMGAMSTPKCIKTCYDGSSWEGSKHFGRSTYSLTSIQAIQLDIMQHGPVEAAFSVYGDFPSYKSGVYHHVTGPYLGGHAIKILGWGTSENGDDYWIAANSWRAEWGDQGFFKIARGNNECGIEDSVVAGLPRLSG